MNFNEATSPALTEAQIAHFSEFGYLSLDQVTSPEDVKVIRGALESLFESKAGFKEGAQFNLMGKDDNSDDASIPQIVGPRHYTSLLKKTEFHANAAAMARQLLGPKVRFIGDHTLAKPAHVGPATPWHQDEAYRNPDFDYQEISFWMPLQPVDASNGCMEFIPATHRGPVLPHRSFNDDVTVHSVECCDGFDPAQRVTCSLPAGGCTIHAGRTLHYSGPNRSDQPRYAYVLVFAIPAVPTKVPRSFPWREGKETPRLQRQRAWMRRGGLLVASWRFVREADLRDIRAVAAKLRLQMAVFFSLWKKK